MEDPCPEWPNSSFTSTVVMFPPPAVKTFETINPASGEVLATVQAAGREDVDRAVKSAQKGQKNLGGDERHGTFAHSA